MLSRRILLEQDREKLRSETLDNLEENAVLKGIVKNITDYGAFIDLGGIDGLLHTDMSWDVLTTHLKCLKLVKKSKLKFLATTKVARDFSCYKQLQTDPWLTVTERYAADSRAKGTVVSLTDYGAFVEMEQGVEGLIHISEMSG